MTAKNLLSTLLAQLSDYVGLGWAIAIVGLWGLTAIVAVLIPFQDVPWWGMIGGILIRTFLHTGLFILAHDAMHINLVPRQLWLNQSLGKITVQLYGMLSYENCRSNHLKHHQQPAQVGDPDFHDGVHYHLLLWYCHFLKGYFSWGQFTKFLGAIAVFSSLTHTLFATSYLSLFIFFLLPLLLSSWQLFIFGTYLPHGKQIAYGKHRQSHHFLRWLWSLLSCYHFGTYHEEHHAQPHQPWFKLPNSIIS